MKSKIQDIEVLNKLNTSLSKEVNALEILINKQYEVLKIYEDNMPVGFLKYMRDQLNLERCNIDRDPVMLEFLDELKIKLNLLQIISDKTDNLIIREKDFRNELLK